MNTFKEKLEAAADWIRDEINWIGMAACLLSIIWLIVSMIRTRFFEWSTIGIAAGIGAVALALVFLFFWFYVRKKQCTIIGWLLILLVVSLSVLGSGLSNMIYESADAMSAQKQEVTKDIVLYTYDQAPLEDLSSHSGQKVDIGLLSGTNQKLNELALNGLKEEGVEVRERRYDSLQQMLKALKGQSIQLVLLTREQTVLADEFAGFEKIEQNLREVRSFTYETGIVPEADPADIEKDPYTILVSVTMDPVDQSDYRSLLNLLLVVNPEKREVLMVEIPRNSWVEKVCSEQSACAGGQFEKLALTSYDSLEVLKETVSKLFDAKINYSVHVDMKTLLKTSDVAGMLHVENQAAGSSDNYTFEEGTIGMGSAKAYSFSRGYNDFSSADKDSESHLMSVLRSVWNLHPDSVVLKAEPILKILSESIRTDFSYEQMPQLYNEFIRFPGTWKVYEMSLLGTDGYEVSPVLTGFTYINYVNADSQNRVKEAIAAVLKGEDVNASQQDIQEAIDAALAAAAEEQARLDEEARAAAEQQEAEAQQAEQQQGENPEAPTEDDQSEPAE